MRKMLFCLCAFLIFSGVFISCSDKKEAAPGKKGAIEEMTDRVAKEAVEKIRTPINKARSVEDIQKNRFSDMEKELTEKP
ncbi:MAG: hypothetical protein RBR01_04065 [Desulfobacterales bacterium]|jgi:hypothetical protein|nr:hypothetical protein [Desulfobacterales bacterium]MDD3082175.1 hypothetical protein [Desulfobacterales bacterium]MDD3951332.1 hypothetical protein [Desulfobacterales bacterium]MDD4462769.1 hypothetical protein [Desulfobacterales bacterium]MDY0377593.1 hypothetical protein [Desulfobacterales bacterium]